MFLLSVCGVVYLSNCLSIHPRANVCFGGCFICRNRYFGVTCGWQRGNCILTISHGLLGMETFNSGVDFNRQRSMERPRRQPKRGIDNTAKPSKSSQCYSGFLSHFPSLFSRLSSHLSLSFALTHTHVYIYVYMYMYIVSPFCVCIYLTLKRWGCWFSQQDRNGVLTNTTNTAKTTNTNTTTNTNITNKRIINSDEGNEPPTWKYETCDIQGGCSSCWGYVSSQTFSTPIYVVSLCD